MRKPSMVALPLPHYYVVVGLLTYMSIIQWTGLYLGGIVLVWYYEQVIAGFCKKEATNIWFFAGLSLCVTGYPILITPLLPLLWLWDQDLIDEKFSKLKKFIDLTGKTSLDLTVPLGQPLTGVNSEFIGMFRTGSPVRECYDDIINELRWGFETTAQYLRTEGVSVTPLDYSDKPALDSTDVFKKYLKYTEGARLSIMIMCGALSIALLGVLGMAVGLMSALVLQMEKTDGKQITDERQRGVTFRDGVYRIANKVFGFEYSHGIGVSHGGVMHVPYHVCHGKAIQHGMGRFYPYMIDVDRDLVTYGGPPQFSKPEKYEQIYVNCETVDSRTSYKVKASWSGAVNTISWPGVTKPGESGSPVYSIEEDKLVLVALAGRYVKDESAMVTEFANVELNDEGDSNYKKIITHPGSGKTRRQIPQLIRETLPGLKGRKILVTGPTRVVCMEMYNALKEEFKVGLNIKGSEAKRDHFASVQIAAHRTALKMLVTGDRITKGIDMVMIDEAHVDDPATILLRQYCKSRLSAGMKLVELSATLDGLTNDGSNFDITDKEIKESEVIDMVRRDLEAGKRVLVFVPSMTARTTKAIEREFRDFNPVKLSRANFEPAMKAVANEENRLIITTDIAECGINVPDLDTVIDLGLKFKYVEESNIIHGQEVGLTPASRTQRRGRVGRSKRGNYYFVKKKGTTTDWLTSSEVDAKILGTGRNWTSGEGNPWDMYLTDKQFRKWLNSEDLTPMEIILTTDVQGIRLKEQDIRMNWEMWKKDKKTYYIGCHDTNCGKCEGSYKFYDERAHDRIFSTIKSGGLRELD